MRSTIRAVTIALAFALSAMPGRVTEADPAGAAPLETTDTITQDAYLRLMNKALDDLIRRLEAAPHTPVSFAANLFFAHEAAIRNMPLDVLLEMVDALAEAGISRVDVNMGLFPWLDGHDPTIQKYDRLIEHIRGQGLGLAINPQYSPVHAFDGFAQWKDAALDVYPRVAQRYQPDVFVVVHEPTTQAGRLGVTVSPAEWEEFAKVAAERVHRVAPDARLGAGGLGSEVECLDRFMRLPQLELLTLDIYALRHLPAFNDVVARAKRFGKTIYIEETWRPGRFEPTPGQPATADEVVSASIGNQAYQSIDARWLRAMTLYAATLGLETVTPFWTQTFFAYVPEDWSGLDPRYNLRVIEAVRRGERTKTYEALVTLVREHDASRAGGDGGTPHSSPLQGSR